MSRLPQCMTQHVFVHFWTLLLNLVTLSDPVPKPEKPTVPPPKPGGGKFSAHFMFGYFLSGTKPSVPVSH